MGRKVRLGVASGTALVGPMGGKAHLSFSVVGPVMRIAAALCELNTRLGTAILLCSNTWKDVREHFVARMVATPVRVCGLVLYADIR